MKKLVQFFFARRMNGVEKFLLLAILLWGFTRNIQSISYMGDENFWVASSVRLDAFLAGDFDAPLWTEDPTIAYEVRPMPSYLAAIGQRLGGFQPRDIPTAYWLWNLSDEENAARNAMPSETVLWWSRIPMAAITALGLWGFAIFLGRAHSRLAAYVFTAVCFNLYFLENLRRAMSEASILFFTILVVLASHELIMVIQKDSLKRIVLWSFVVGILSGLAGESKLTGLACAGIGIVCALIVINRGDHVVNMPKVRLSLIVIVVIVYTTLLTFIAIYPFFYHNPADRIAETFQARQQILNYQLVDNADQRIPPGDRLEILYQRVFQHPVAFHASPFWNALNFILAFIGLGVSIRKSLGKSGDAPAYQIILVAAVFCAGPMLLTPFDWERYYMFPIFFACVFFTVGAAHIVAKLSVPDP